VLRSKVRFIKREFRKLFSDVEIRTANFYIEEVVSDVTIFVYASTDLTKDALPSSFQIEAFSLSTFLRYFPLVLSLWTLSISCSGTRVATTQSPL